jgi:hypothetical protein
MLHNVAKIVVALLVTLLCPPAFAQTLDSGSVSGQGHVVLRPKVTILRFHLVLSERGDDMETVLKSLDRRGDAFRKALLEAKATKDSIKLDGPRLVGQLQPLGELIPAVQYWGKGKANQQAQMNAPAQQAPNQTPYSAPLSQTPASEAKRAPRIMVQISLTAEWPLEGASSPALLVEADRIVLQVHEQIKDLMPKPKTPVRQVPSPKLQKSSDPFDQDEQEDQDDASQASQPSYAFVGRVSAEQIRKAQSEAFEHAKAGAAATAEIGGRLIGAMESMSVSLTRPGGYDFEDPFASGPTYVQPPTMQPQSLDDRSAPTEAVGLDPSSLQYPISVSAIFHLQPPASPAAPGK